jgi:hypothetical protein
VQREVEVRAAIERPVSFSPGEILPAGRRAPFPPAIHFHGDQQPAPIVGDPALLHLLFYQFAKNSVKELLLHREEGHLWMTTQRFTIQNQPGVAVMIADNGGGLDLTALIKSKYGKSGDDPESPFHSEWQWLNLSIHQVMQLIFERKITGSVNGSGIGLAMARLIADLHHCAIWVTNAKGGGAKFLFIFEENGGTALHDQIPALFDLSTVPAALLDEICAQLA